MKYIVLIGDGMTDYPLKKLKGKTPLSAAKTPNMDFLAQKGIVGWVNNVPRGMQPASDVANMSIFGYDPKKYYSGRGPLEAASLGVKLKKDEVAFRCNLVSIKNHKMSDFTAGHIDTVSARRIIELLDQKLGTKEIRFYPGLSYRHLLVIKSGAERSRCADVATTPPHDITGKNIGKYLPKGRGAQLLLQLMNESEVLLHNLGTQATMIWPWGQGKSPTMPAFVKKFGKKGAIITAVDLLKGMGKVLGMEVINVPGATGYLDTDYEQKARYALRALKRNDVVFVHVEAPDEAGHEGNIKHKIQAIQDFDKYVVGTVLEWTQQHSNIATKILVLPDHPTPIRLMTHTADPVPFVIYQNGERPLRAEQQRFAQGEAIKARKVIKGVKGYSEKEIKKSKLRIKNGHELLKFLFK
ncbi:MAG: cofactor-independent phosphoglycerate mutase [Candidatus Saganbacteria bacterium]|nr:cofactor-independent phosphoglycerate mutase [Candidatus Saganbacteria bacterium]